jgi:hypothetical protein
MRPGLREGGRTRLKGVVGEVERPLSYVALGQLPLPTGLGPEDEGGDMPLLLRHPLHGGLAKIPLPAPQVLLCQARRPKPSRSHRGTASSP